MSVFTYQHKVLFQHCDPAGIVFYPRYFEMVNATVEAWFAERLGVPFEQVHGPMEAAVPMVAMDIHFLAPSRHGEVLEFRLQPTRIGRSSLGLEIGAWCQGARRVAIEATAVFTTKGAGRSAPWPELLRAPITRDIEQAESHA